MGASYRIYKCVNCGKNSKTERVYDGLNFGVPLYKCKHCGEMNYDQFILEPALLNPQVLINDKRKWYNTILILLYMPVGVCAFFGLTLLFESFIIGTIISLTLLALLTGVILKKKRRVSIQDYAEEIDASISRLSENQQYAQLVINFQGNDKESAWSKVCTACSYTTSK